MYFLTRTYRILVVYYDLCTCPWFLSSSTICFLTTIHQNLILQSFVEAWIVVHRYNIQQQPTLNPMVALLLITTYFLTRALCQFLKNYDNNQRTLMLITFQLYWQREKQKKRRVFLEPPDKKKTPDFTDKQSSYNYAWSQCRCWYHN